jgi:hypothetical protein
MLSSRRPFLSREKRRNHLLGHGLLKSGRPVTPHSVYNDGDEDRIHLILDLKVNDFLRRVFPEPTPRERMEMLAARCTMPLLWPFFKIHFSLKQMFARVPPPVEAVAKF